MSIFMLDEGRGIYKTYTKLIEDINERSTLKKYIYEESPYEIFLGIIHSMVYGLPVTLLDSEFSSEDLMRLGLTLEELKEGCIVKPMPIINFDDLMLRILNNKEKWSISLYSSGTTGTPKKITHQYNTVARNVRVNEKSKYHIWGFAYNPTHFAGLQVLLQAIFNENPLIYLFDAERSKLGDQIKKYGITHISATPTYYRTMMAFLEEPIFSVRQLTLGGEKYDPALEAKLKAVFPESAITNIYASTEAGSLFRSRGECFEIPGSIKELVKIQESGELLVHRKLMASSDAILNVLIDGEWYPTGDLVQRVGEGRFRFTSRKSELVNVGGYKVNPHEVEEEILKIEGIQDVSVYGRSNRVTGNILAAKVNAKAGIDEKELERQIIDYLKTRLPKWQIPREITFCSEIEITRTGKKVRS